MWGRDLRGGLVRIFSFISPSFLPHHFLPHPSPPLRPGDVNGSMAALRMAAKQIQNELNGIVKVWT